MLKKVAYGNRVLVDVSASLPNRTKGGIQLPERTAVDPIGFGTVVSVGPGAMTAGGWDSNLLRIGDEVTFERARAHVIDRQNFIAAMWAGDVLAVTRESDIVNPEPTT